MSHYALLLKKQLFDAFPFGSKSARSKNILGYILAGILAAGIIAAFVIIFSRFTSTYLQIKINRVPNLAARQFELMSVAYFALIIVFIITGVTQLCYNLFENSDIRILISMPFSSFEIFAAKLTWIYIKQAALSLACVLALNLTFFCAANLISAYNVIMSFIIGLLLPVIPLAIASVLALPYYYVKKLVGSNYLLSFAVMTLILIGFCLLYNYAFTIAQGLIDSGKIASLFNERVMTNIHNFAIYDYPANLIAGIMLGKDVGKNIGILLAILAVSAAVGLLVIHKVFVRVTQTGISVHIPHLKREGYHFVKRSRFGNLIAKEFITVLRTPSYAYMYFATAIIMPLMAYCSANLGTAFLGGLLGNVRFDFELCTFIVLLYSSLTNTFCSTSISRDGYMSMAQKTLPYSPAQILSAKMLFSGIVSELSILAACITLAACGLESAGDAVVTFISATIFAIAQIAFATRLDLNHPHFSRTDDGEIKETNSTVSIIILVGLVMCFAIGMLLMQNTIRGLISGTEISTDKSAAYAYALCVPLALLAGAAAFFFVNLKKVYANLDSEG